MSDAKFAALLAFLAAVIAPFLALIAKRLEAARLEARAAATALLESSVRIESKVDGEATARRKQIDQLQSVLTQKNAEIAQADKVQALTEVELDAARKSPPEPER